MAVLGNQNIISFHFYNHSKGQMLFFSLLFTDMETEAQKGKDWNKSHTSFMGTPRQEPLRVSRKCE